MSGKFGHLIFGVPESEGSVARKNEIETGCDVQRLTVKMEKMKITFYGGVGEVGRSASLIEKGGKTCFWMPA